MHFDGLLGVEFAAQADVQYYGGQVVLPLQFLGGQRCSPPIVSTRAYEVQARATY
ncbi:MAG: hypothetical protein ABI593_05170 [Betaproteobacteria bacterium]